jgi:hypothetical protein
LKIAIRQLLLKSLANKSKPVTSTAAMVSLNPLLSCPLYSHSSLMMRPKLLYFIVLTIHYRKILKLKNHFASVLKGQKFISNSLRLSFVYNSPLNLILFVCCLGRCQACFN